MCDMNDVFSSFQDYVNEEQNLREEIRLSNKNIDQETRKLKTTLQSIHRADGISRISEICAQARLIYPQLKEGFSRLAALIPRLQYYRYHDTWKFNMQQLSFLTSLIIYLETEQMATIQQVAELIGVKTNQDEGFHIDLEDYLLGLLDLASELARFAVNSVTNGDYKRPLDISRFVLELNAGFRLLNLKNNALRKRYDVLKYDVKKIEEIVYDLSIRGLKPTRIDDEQIS